MSNSKFFDDIPLRLRAHHICCTPHLEIGEARGDAFIIVKQRIIDAMLKPSEVPVMLIEGTDMLCTECPSFSEGRCISPKGGDEGVRKWDAILISQLGVNYGDCLSAREWAELKKANFPVRLCHKCGWRLKCTTGAKIPA